MTELLEWVADRRKHLDLVLVSYNQNPLIITETYSRTQELFYQLFSKITNKLVKLQPDFLYEHIQPVRAELMQALWRTLRNPNDQIAHVAFRVLGKFGGGNRKMMIEPQALDYR